MDLRNPGSPKLSSQVIYSTTLHFSCMLETRPTLVCHRLQLHVGAILRYWRPAHRRTISSTTKSRMPPHRVSFMHLNAGRLQLRRAAQAPFFSWADDLDESRYVLSRLGA